MESLTAKTDSLINLKNRLKDENRTGAVLEAKETVQEISELESEIIQLKSEISLLPKNHSLTAEELSDELSETQKASNTPTEPILPPDPQAELAKIRAVLDNKYHD